MPTNLARDADVERMVAATIEQYGRVDILVNNAAITFPGDLDMEMKRFDLVMQVDLRAPLLAMQAVIPAMKARGEGAILNISSVAGLNYFPGLMAYGMAKAALEHLTVSAAHQLAPFGIAVNTFRIDVPVASEGFVFNLPDGDHSDWEPSEVAAEGIVWMLEQPPSYTRPQRGHGRAARRARDHGVTRRRGRTAASQHSSRRRTYERCEPASMSTDALYIDIAARKRRRRGVVHVGRDHHRRQLLRDIDVGGRVGRGRRRGIGHRRGRKIGRGQLLAPPRRPSPGHAARPDQCVDRVHTHCVDQTTPNP